RLLLGDAPGSGAFEIQREHAEQGGVIAAVHWSTTRVRELERRNDLLEGDLVLARFCAQSTQRLVEQAGKVLLVCHGTTQQREVRRAETLADRLVRCHWGTLGARPREHASHRCHGTAVAPPLPIGNRARLPKAGIITHPRILGHLRIAITFEQGDFLSLSLGW